MTDIHVAFLCRNGTVTSSSSMALYTNSMGVGLEKSMECHCLRRYVRQEAVSKNDREPMNLHNFALAQRIGGCSCVKSIAVAQHLFMRVHIDEQTVRTSGQCFIFKSETGVDSSLKHTEALPLPMWKPPQFV